METKLKNLYQRLIENRKHEVEGWHKDYKRFYNEVAEMRKRIKAGEGLSKKDEEFLLKLIFVKANGISSRGQSILSWDNFYTVIANKSFISTLQQLILEPNKDSFIAFAQEWPKQVGKNNPLLVNRVAGACTLDVCTVVDPKKFDTVFNWLIDEEIIPEYPKENGKDWFSKSTFLMKAIKSEFKNELKSGETDEFYLSIFVWEMHENMNKPFSLKKQVIMYGVPGTGKTYQAQQQTKLQFNNWKEEFAPGNDSFAHESQIEMVQFHPSFSYEDFIEGLRPILDDDGAAQLTLQNGIFKKFCRNAGKWEIDVYSIGLDKEWKDITIEDLKPHREKLPGDRWDYIFEISDSSKLVSEAVPPFYFIIDEVNRAELSRVFGELMFCLEYRGVEGKIKTQYANLNNDSTGMLKLEQGYFFFVPTNVYLMGTMNITDRSIESFDFALRRRFRWEEVSPDTWLLKRHLEGLREGWGALADNLENLNNKISDEPLLGSDYQIGHAYLMNLKYDKRETVSDIRERVWADSICPLLQEYLRGAGQGDGLIDSFWNAFEGE